MHRIILSLLVYYTTTNLDAINILSTVSTIENILLLLRELELEKNHFLAVVATP
uniref:Uncharacterized protein n=1 Tax=Daucus carota subsp. sativus TaxID=79200 RepID=A0A166AXJ4_DAUCS